MRGPVGEAVQQANGRAALIGYRMDSLGVPSVMADDTQAIGLAIEHLRTQGHRRSDESAVAALSACRDMGFPVPHRMSVVVSGDGARAAHCNPPLTCVDVDLELHVQLALEMLERASAGGLPPTDRLRLIEPRLVQRASVAPPWADDSTRGRRSGSSNNSHAFPEVVVTAAAGATFP